MIATKIAILIPVKVCINNKNAHQNNMFVKSFLYVCWNSSEAGAGPALNHMPSITDIEALALL